MIRYLAVGLGLAVLLLLWRVDHLAQELNASEDSASQYQRSTESLRATIRTTRELLLENAERDKKHTQELKDAQDQNQRLRADVADARQRLLVRARCPAVPADTAPVGLADAGAAELDPDARQDYFTLRDQLALTRQQVLGLQDYITHTCLIGQNTGVTDE